MRCIITTEGFGEMVFELYPEHAPLTVKNFEDTAKSGFYDGLVPDCERLRNSGRFSGQ